MPLKDKLQRLKKHINTTDSSEFTKSEVSKDSVLEDFSKWEEFGTVRYELDGGVCYVRTVEYPLTHKHGLYKFNQIFDVVEEWNRLSLVHPLSSRGYKTSDLFFFDTETTGLHGGTGNTIFLLGHAQVLADKVIVKQHFLPSPDGEIALYHSFLSHVNYSTLVTYNGKAFDWPQVKTRHTLVRNHVPKLPEFGHFDLLHASRRFWKDDLEAVKLSIVERDIIQVTREDDVPGYLAPMIYFTYLQDRKPDSIFQVLRHNEYDLLSLITLYIHLSRLLLLPEQGANNTERLRAARWLEQLGNHEMAMLLYEPLVKEGIEQAMWHQSILYKKNQQWQHSLHLWELLHNGDNIELKVGSLVELAKYYEHINKNYQLALNFAQKCYTIIKSNNTFCDSDIVKRIARLEKKSIPRESAKNALNRENNPIL
ncbi:hypothetical protein EJF36_10860 [Bacillus sp. HMF5848]|uniref:ribonuclease H-like domain-containing protein n=1 Tax=Bacillus sp. HMF5848 TaxID=2495421 RepID=UPI000F79E272|nr:ribonuclease H-like domain-containing protein [Bacillus sp. HMF5848]RSK27341.1 hypothetical protein EJF36_10860 [Bacillus sp. HMF5848]